MTLGQKILQARKKKGWSQSDLSYEARIPSSALAMYERGSREPRLPQLRKIAGALGVSVQELLRDVE